MPGEKQEGKKIGSLSGKASTWKEEERHLQGNGRKQVYMDGCHASLLRCPFCFSHPGPVASENRQNYPLGVREAGLNCNRDL